MESNWIWITVELGVVEAEDYAEVVNTAIKFYLCGQYRSVISVNL